MTSMAGQETMTPTTPATPPASLRVGDSFPTMDSARRHILEYIISRGESYYVYAANTTRQDYRCISAKKFLDKKKLSINTATTQPGVTETPPGAMAPASATTCEGSSASAGTTGPNTASTYHTFDSPQNTTNATGENVAAVTANNTLVDPAISGTSQTSPFTSGTGAPLAQTGDTVPHTATSGASVPPTPSAPPATTTNTSPPTVPDSTNENEHCRFHIRVSYHHKSSTFMVRRFEPHTCPPSTHANFRGQNSQRYLQSQLRHLVVDEKSITPRALGVHQQRDLSRKANYQALLRARNGVLTKLTGRDPGQYSLIQPFLQRLAPSAYTRFHRDESSKQFRYAFILPKAAKHAAQNSPPLLFIHTCAFREARQGHVFGAYFLDATNRVINLAFGAHHTRQETKEAWIDFLSFVKESMGVTGTDEYPATVPTKFTSKLAEAFKEVFPRGHLYYCLHNLTERLRSLNIEGHMERQIHHLAYEPAKTRFEATLQSMEKRAEQIGLKRITDFIRALDPTRWTLCDSPLEKFPRFGSKMAYTVEGSWDSYFAMGQDQQLTYLAFLYSFWVDSMTTYPARRSEIAAMLQEGKRLTDFSSSYLEDQKERSTRYFIHPASEVEALVAGSKHAFGSVDCMNEANQGDDDNSKTPDPLRLSHDPKDIQKVNLSTLTCTCREFQDFRIPCCHAQAFIYWTLHRKKFAPVDPSIDDTAARELAVEDYMTPFWKTEKCLEAFSKSLEPVTLDEISPDDGTLPPDAEAPFAAGAIGTRRRGRPSGSKRPGDHEQRNSPRLKRRAFSGPVFPTPKSS